MPVSLRLAKYLQMYIGKISTSFQWRKRRRKKSGGRVGIRPRETGRSVRACGCVCWRRRKGGIYLAEILSCSWVLKEVFSLWRQQVPSPSRAGSGVDGRCAPSLPALHSRLIVVKMGFIPASSQVAVSYGCGVFSTRV